MRQLLVEHARGYGRRKRLSPQQRTSLELETISAPGPDAAVLEIHQALEAMVEKYPRSVRVVELRYFGGFSLQEIAEIMGTSRITAARDWSLARALLSEELSDRQAEES